MTAHELAKKLLEGPDLPVTIPYGYHASDIGPAEVQDVDLYKANLKKSNDYFYRVDHIHLGGSPWDDQNSNQ